MKETYAFDQLRKPLRKLPDDSPTLISDEKWDKMLCAHDDALELASKPRTLKQKIDNFFFGLISTVFLVGFALIMTMPELRTLIGRIFDQLVHNMS